MSSAAFRAHGPEKLRIFEELAADLGIVCRLEEPLARHTTMGVGGPTPALFLPADATALAALVKALAASNTRYRVLGAGSNLIVADEGISTPVIATEKLAAPTVCDTERVHAAAGALLPKVAREMAGAGLSGLEFAEGIPGSVGGALRMNAGAGGRWVGDAARAITVVTPSGERVTHAVAHGDFGYRRSFVASGDLIVVDAVFAAVPDDPQAIRERMRDSRAYRLATQPLSERSSGCVFKNPEGGSAGELLDRLGLKGLTVGGASVSEHHANFIVNRGGSAADVLAVAETVREKARASAGLDLEFEVVVWRDAP